MNEEILQLIPHRPPFLFVDEIVSQSPEGMVTRRAVRADEDFFCGHYPDNPIMPGVLISEAVFQTGALFLVKALASDDDDLSGHVPVLTRINDARFRSIVRPGDELTIEVKLKERMGKFFFLRGTVSCGTRKVMSVDFGVALAAPEPPPAGGEAS